MSFEADLYAHLIADNAISQQIAERLWPVIREEGSGLPAITYQVISEVPSNDLDELDGSLINYRVQLDVWASGYDAARILKELMRARLQTPATTFSALPVGGGLDLYEDETKIFRVSMDFSMWYSVP